MSSNASVMVRSKYIGAGFVRIVCMIFFNEFFGMHEVESGGPLIFFIGTLVAHPSYIIEEFTQGPALEVVFQV